MKWFGVNKIREYIIIVLRIEALIYKILYTIVGCRRTCVVTVGGSHLVVYNVAKRVFFVVSFPGSPAISTRMTF